MGSERIGRRVASGLQEAGTGRVIQVTVRDQDMRDIFTLKTCDQCIEMCWIVGSRINNGNRSGTNNVGAGAEIGKSTWVAGSESADTGRKYFDLSVLKIMLTDKWDLRQRKTLTVGWTTPERAGRRSRQGQTGSCRTFWDSLLSSIRGRGCHSRPSE